MSLDSPLLCDVSLYCGMSRFTNFDRDRIFGLLDSGVNVTDQTARFGVNRRTIQRLQHRFTKTASSVDMPWLERLPVTPNQIHSG